MNQGEETRYHVDQYLLDESFPMQVVTRGSSIGKFYLDLYPREGKSGHMACFGLQPGCLQQDGRRQIAIAAMVANFTKSTPNPPSLLQHDELETYFHEFWQAMHQLRSQGASTWQRVSGLHTFAWLRAGKKTNDKKGTLPATLATAGDENQREGSGAGSAAPCLFNLRQIVLAKVDKALHTQTPADPAQENARLCQEVLGVPATP
ncbi:hypothetical protein J1605_014000, partial [Eschrichtius robustus]